MDIYKLIRIFCLNLLPSTGTTTKVVLVEMATVKLERIFGQVSSCHSAMLVQ